MPGFYPRTTPKSRSPPNLRFAALLDDDEDDDDEDSTISSNNSSDDSLFLHLEEESLFKARQGLAISQSGGERYPTMDSPDPK